MVYLCYLPEYVSRNLYLSPLTKKWDSPRPQKKVAFRNLNSEKTFSLKLFQLDQTWLPFHACTWDELPTDGCFIC